MPSLGRRLSPKYKQMAFDTAVRNPERYLNILNIIKKFEHETLTNEVLLKIMSELYIAGEVTSRHMVIQQDMTIEDIADKVVEVNRTRKADGGFPAGYCSRFWTYMRTLAELGFVYARYMEPLLISEIGKKLINKEIDEQEAFSIQASKYNRNSPYRNVKNDYNFFRLAIDLILSLREKGKRLSSEQFIILMFNKSGDYNETKNILEENSFPNDESAYKYVMEHYGCNLEMVTVTRDYPDVVRRVMIIAGFITIRFEGKRFIEVNENKLAYIKDLFDIDFHLTDEEKKNPKKYFLKLGFENGTYYSLINKYKDSDSINGVEYTSKLYEIIDQYNLNESILSENIEKIEAGRDTIDEFKEIPKPLKLEFFISLLVALKYKGVFYIKPNYKADHVGKPYSHAPGNSGDINIYSDSKYWLIEVTLIRNKTQQLNSETTTVIRHLAEEGYNKDKYISLVAPVIHVDTKKYLDYALVEEQISYSHKINGKPYNLSDFIQITNQMENLDDMENYTDSMYENFRSRIYNK